MQLASRATQRSLQAAGSKFSLLVGQAKDSQQAACTLCFFAALIPWCSRRQVVYTGEGAAPLLRVVNTTPDPGAAPGAPLAPCVREEHLVPFVREIVPAVDADAQVALLQAPPGLLELGRRRALLEGLRPQLLVRLPVDASHA